MRLLSFCRPEGRGAARTLQVRSGESPNLAAQSVGPCSPMRAPTDLPEPAGSWEGGAATRQPT